MGDETSRTLDILLTESGYNQRMRPQFGGEPVKVGDLRYKSHIKAINPNSMVGGGGVKLTLRRKI